MSYVWDVFLSYPRSEQVQPWIDKHFLPVLRGHLDGLLLDEPKIFVDSTQPTGVQWPEHIRDALLRSRIMVAVWTPPYFRSQWCMAEWVSMLKREDALKSAGKPQPNGLVYPVKFSDGHNFDERAKTTQSRDLTQFAYKYDSFRDSPRYLDFDDAVRAIAQEIELRLGEAPDWSPDFPFADPASVVENTSRIKLPRL
ncbi:TIR domain-containing protein [Rhizobium leguminosarum]|uniref:toll/interleukin-1 receptor domain-containing protein n=1 Tax=Rhizobium leguminosarum TaxID=384 RepID=UPI000FEC8199|nr:toll/interleukin-1 receptor domain-containing protein [Rhizobium leguminosarum]RWX19233.1 TIR domain-containing protein [Rhizobium leguminosarum]